MDAPPRGRNPAAQLHFHALMEEVARLRKRVSQAKGWYYGANIFLYEYHDIIARCPSHARIEVSDALLRVAERTGLTDPAHPPIHSDREGSEPPAGDLALVERPG